MIKFLFEGAPVRGAVVQSSDEWQNMIRFHKYPENVASLLGQFAAGALLLSSTIKFDGALILQVKGSGPIQLIVVEVRTPLSVRAMAQLREGAEITPDMDLQALINQDNKGQCAIILDPKDRRAGVQPIRASCLCPAPPSQKILRATWYAANSLRPNSGLPRTVKRSADFWFRRCRVPAAQRQKPMTLTPGAESFRSPIPSRMKNFWIWPQRNFCIASSGRKKKPIAEDDVSFSCNCSRERTSSMLQQLGYKNVWISSKPKARSMSHAASATRHRRTRLKKLKRSLSRPIRTPAPRALIRSVLSNRF